MNIETLYENVYLPTYALSVLINGDATGSTDEDLEQINKFEKNIRKDCKREFGKYPVSIVYNYGESEFFSLTPEFGLPCDCVDCEVLVNL